MTAKLEKTIKRELVINDTPYTIAISPDGIKLTQKGFRKGHEVTWRELLDESGPDRQSPQSADGTSHAVDRM